MLKRCNSVEVSHAPDRRMYIAPMNTHPPHQIADLVRLATAAMSERGLQPEFSKAVDQQLAAMQMHHELELTLDQKRR